MWPHWAIYSNADVRYTVIFEQETKDIFSFNSVSYIQYLRSVSNPPEKNIAKPSQVGDRFCVQMLLLIAAGCLSST